MTSFCPPLVLSSFFTLFFHWIQNYHVIQQHLVGSTVDYAKGVAGIGHAKAATSVQDATNNPQGQQTAQTLGGLVNESRDLAANVLGAVKG